jgi:hypothetical protein
VEDALREIPLRTSVFGHDGWKIMHADAANSAVLAEIPASTAEFSASTADFCTSNGRFSSKV